jgi:ribosomal subunit interface protein
MQIQISGRHVDLGDNFKEHAEKRLADHIPKYLDRMNRIDVVVSKQGSAFRVDIHGNTSTHAGLVVKSHGQSHDIYAAFDEAATRVEKQLRRYKRRLKSHHIDAAPQNVSDFTAKKYVLEPESHDELTEEGAPVIVAEKATDIEHLTLREAVMKMDLADLPALMFLNTAHGRLNVVYRRNDGHISWVDPSLTEKAA